MHDKLDLTNASAFEFCKSSSETIASICQPFFETTGLTTFIYGRVFFDGRYLVLTNQVKWIKTWFQEIYGLNGTSLQSCLLQTPLNKPTYSLWTSFPNDRIIRFNNRCGLWHGFDISYRLEDSFEEWSFASSKDAYQLSNFYINNLEFIHHFCLYFREKAASLMKTDDERRLAVFKEHLDLSYRESIALEGSFNTFLQSFPLTKYLLYTKNGAAKLSKRELECMFHMSSSHF